MKGFTPKLIELLRAEGCYFVKHGKGDHDHWFSPISNIQFTVDHCIMSRHTANGCLKQAGLPKRF